MSAAVTPIDLAQLARYTGGDAQIDAEVLALLARQIATGTRNFEAHLAGFDANAWRETAHALKGAALGVGAGELARIAARMEKLDPASRPAEAAEQLQAFRCAARRVAAFIEARPKL